LGDQATGDWLLAAANQFERKLGVEIAQDVAELTENFKGLKLDAI
jgi:hypothetical protein